MMRVAWGVVEGVLTRRSTVQELAVLTGDGPGRAINYVAATGVAAPGDRVLLNTTAVSLGLGSGGYHFVLAVAGREEREAPASGRLMKLRYTPWQVQVEAWEEATDAAPAAGATPDLAGMPVVVGELHSQLAPVVLAARRAYRGGSPRIAYVMTDGGALAAAYSRQAWALREAGWLAAVITAGHAFGGDLEAVSVHSALLAARVAVAADLAVVLMGPGIAGTNSPLGFSGTEQAWILDAAGALGGRPVALGRLSFADARARHRGLSHHTRTNLGRLTHRRALLPLPRMHGEERDLLERQLNESGIPARHQLLWLPAGPLEAALAESPVPLESMGRAYGEDPWFFLSAAAAGWLAGRLAVNAAAREA